MTIPARMLEHLKERYVSSGMCNPVTDSDGNRWWFNKEGELYREDGPAAIWADRREEWYFHGKLHRSNGPAIIFNTGRKIWYQRGILTRLDGPAVVWGNGTKEWWFNGVEIEEHEHPFIKFLKQYCLYRKWKDDTLTEDEQVLIQLSLS